MLQKKYISLSKLSIFLDNLNNKFASLHHNHTINDITDLAVDSELSSTSVNPVQNKVIDAEFEAISVAMDVLEKAIDEKVDANTLSNYSTTEESKLYTDNAVAQKTQVQIITWGADD